MTNSWFEIKLLVYSILIISKFHPRLMKSQMRYLYHFFVFHVLSHMCVIYLLCVCRN